MKRRIALPHARKFAVLAVLVTALVTAFTISPAATAAPPTGTVTATPVTGTLANGGTFAGTLSNIQFVNQQGSLAVVGQLTGTLTNAAGAVIGSVTNVPITLPVTGAQATGSCQILDLVLGPLDLNLLGLVAVHLNIKAQRGPGNLLRNLLCGLACAIDGGGGGGLANLLNRLLGL